MCKKDSPSFALSTRSLTTLSISQVFTYTYMLSSYAFLSSFAEKSFQYVSTATSTQLGAAIVRLARPPDSAPHMLRDMYPRQPWHDIHTKLTGIPARDIASHFVQVHKSTNNNTAGEREKLSSLALNSSLS
jgi:hypothetical protein